jgi:hypothetical protein
MADTQRVTIETPQCETCGRRATIRHGNYVHAEGRLVWHRYCAEHDPMALVAVNKELQDEYLAYGCSD